MIGYHYFKESQQTIQNTYQFKNVNQLDISINGLITNIFDSDLDIKNYDDNHHKLVAELFSKYGDEFHKYLNGLFIIIIKDSNKTGIYNNRYLSTNLYYYHDDNIFIYSNHLKELIKALPNKREVDFSVLKQFLSNGWSITDKTMIKGVNRIQPTMRLIATDKLLIENHWDEELTFERRPFSNLEEHMDKYENIYRGGIEDFMYQNKTQELGTLLSGGHDTSFALIQGSKAHKKQMHSFTVTFPGWAFDEGPFAQNLSNKFKSIHHEIPFTPDDLDYMPSLIVANEIPVVGSSLPLHLCGKEAANHVDTMLGGDGGDTMWGEYFPVAEYHKYIKNLPLSLRKIFHNISKALRNTFDWERFWELEHVSELFTHENMYDDFLRRLCTYRHFNDDYLDNLLNSDLKETPFAKSSMELEFNKENFSEMLIEGKLLNGFYNYQSFHTYRSMEHFNLELYFPTIHRDVLRLITELPINWVNGGTTFHKLTNAHSVNRRFHKKVLSRYLKKEEIYNRSFDIPWYNILKPRKELLQILKNRLIKRGWYNKEAIVQMFDEFGEQKIKDYELLELKNHGYRIFTLLSLEIWCIEFLDDRNTKNYDEKIPLEEYLAD
jgi:asparagine synthase (glutamine-hydrolysing)